MDNPTFSMGQKFADFDTFKKAVRSYSIVSKRPLKFKRSDKRRVQVVCQPGCKWNIWCAKTNEGVQIKTCDLKHEGCVLTFQNKFGDHHYIARKYQQRFQVDPNWGIASVMQTVKEDLHWNISRWKAARVRKNALKLVQGSAEEQYHRLREYCSEVRKSNIGSTSFVEANEDGVFRRMYCCLAACRDGFLAGCRKIICIDGCFLKTFHGGAVTNSSGC
ncbi:hypothetical protein LINPERPRIM_LOCUS35131 [Linum perenne]